MGLNTAYPGHCSFVLAAALFPTYALANSIGDFQESVSESTQHAIAQIGSFWALLFVLVFFGGLGMIVSSVRRYMKAETNERETMGPGKVITGCAIGGIAMVFPLALAVGHNTLWGGSITSAEMSNFAIDGGLATQNALDIREGPAKYLPPAAIIAFYGILALIGATTVYMGLRDVYIAVMYGNDMYGTSLPFKTGKVSFQIVFGLALVFLNYTQCTIIMTFGLAESMCWSNM